jgi:hypothetical protein
MVGFAHSVKPKHHGPPITSRHTARLANVPPAICWNGIPDSLIHGLEDPSMTHMPVHVPTTALALYPAHMCSLAQSTC